MLLLLALPPPLTPQPDCLCVRGLACTPACMGYMQAHTLARCPPPPLLITPGAGAGSCSVAAASAITSPETLRVCVCAIPLAAVPAGERGEAEARWQAPPAGLRGRGGAQPGLRVLCQVHRRHLQAHGGAAAQGVSEPWCREAQTALRARTDFGRGRPLLPCLVPAAARAVPAQGQQPPSHCAAPDG